MIFIDIELSPITWLDYTDWLPYIIRFYFLDAENEDRIKCNFALNKKLLMHRITWKNIYLQTLRILFFIIWFIMQSKVDHFMIFGILKPRDFSYLHHQKNRIENNQGHDEVLERCRLNNPPKPIFETNSFFWHVTF